MKTIYVDMDGVLCDFMTSYMRLRRKYNQPGSEYIWKFFSKMVKEEKLFENLDVLPNAGMLLNALKELEGPNVKIEILTSGGDKSGTAHYEAAKEQKIKWLKDHNINWPVNVVKHRVDKDEYACADCILIDDTLSNVEEFIAAGGKAILYDDAKADQAIQIVRAFVDKV